MRNLLKNEPYHAQERALTSSLELLISNFQDWLSKMEVIRSTFVMMFLPKGYPDSVSQDYIYFQLFDTLQGFVGYVQGQLLVLCYLTALGIGNQEATVMSAMSVWIFKDTTGVLVGLCSGLPQVTSIFAQHSTIPFWKMVAELIRAFTGFLDIYASLQSSSVFLFLSCISTAFNTVAGVIEQQTRATLMSHFAIQNNFADCAAKESNQDRGVKVFGIPLAFLWLLTIQANEGYLFMGYIFLAISKVMFTYLAVNSLSIQSEISNPKRSSSHHVNEQYTDNKIVSTLRKRKSSRAGSGSRSRSKENGSNRRRSSSTREKER